MIDQGQSKRKNSLRSYRRNTFVHQHGVLTPYHPEEVYAWTLISKNQGPDFIANLFWEVSEPMGRFRLGHLLFVLVLRHFKGMVRMV